MVTGVLRPSFLFRRAPYAVIVTWEFSGAGEMGGPKRLRVAN